MGKYVKRLSSSKRRKLWGRVRVRITSIFSFPTHTRAHFARQITKRLQNIFNMVTKQRQNWNTERIMHFLKIAAYVQVAKLYGLVHYVACVFCHIYMACGLRLVCVVGQAVYAFLACMGVECVIAWACLTALCICKCRCKIYYTL